MKKITKKEAAKYAKDVTAMLERLGFAAYPGDEPGYDYRQDARRIMTDFGAFLVHLPSYMAGETLYDLNGRFEDTSVFGDFSSPARAKAHRFGIDLPSGKWCILAYETPAVLMIFERHMAWVNARRPTPEEQAAWDAADKALAAELSVSRREFRESLAQRDACPTPSTLPSSPSASHGTSSPS